MSEQQPAEARFSVRVLKGIRRLLRRLGIRMTLFVTIREGAIALEPIPADKQFTLTELTAADVDELFQLEPVFSRAQMSRFFAKGKICYGMREGPRLVARTWCDLEEMSYPLAPRELQAGEAYLFAAYSDPAYRGRGLAPMLRSACYEELRRRGYSRFYSHSEYFNRPARRFKQKLGAIEEDLRININLFGKWSKTLTIKRYR